MDRDLKNRISVLYQRIVPIGESVDNGRPVKGQPRYRRTDQVRFHIGECEANGEIIVALPFGNMTIKDQPCYNIRYFDGKKVKMATSVPESDIIEVISLK